MEAVKIGPDMTSCTCETGTKQPLTHNRRVSTLLSHSFVSKVPVTFQVHNQVFKSNLKKTSAVPS